MDFSRQREKNKARRNASIIKARLKTYGEDLKLIKMIEERIAINRDRMDIGSGWSSSEAVQGGGTSQEDKINKLIDKIKDDERELKVIELENRALVFAINSLDDKDKIKIMIEVWALGRSLYDVARELNLSDSSAWRKSDQALNEIYRMLYIMTPKEVDPS